jgi:rhamnosyltransferase
MEFVAAIVVLYNPSLEVTSNIESYITQVNHTFIIDNSNENNLLLLSKLDQEKITYYPLYKNEGIGRALNIGVKKAMESNYQYILTMDQDSIASPFIVRELLKVITSSENAGIAACEHINPDFQKVSVSDNTEEVLYTITSGNLLKLDACKTVGGFREDMFIDHIDHEYCLRLNFNGFKVLKTTSCFIYHKVGNTIDAKIFNITVTPTNHPPVRLYYRTRNRLIVNKQYKHIFPSYVREDRKNFLRELLGTIFFEHNVMSKLIMMWRGYRDFHRKKLGEYDY